MAFTLIQKAAVWGNANNTSLTLNAASQTPMAALTANSLRVVGVGHDAGPLTNTMSGFTAGPTITQGTWQGQLFYQIGGAGGGTSITVNYGANADNRRMALLEFSSTDIGNTVFVDATIAANASSTALASGDITVAGTDILALGMSYSGNPGQVGQPQPSSLQIDGLAATDSITQADSSTGGPIALWYRAFGAGFTGGASATLSAARIWACGVIAFRIGGAGGGSAVPVIVNHFRQMGSM